jgi:large subunit ribosomal protein L7Ae
MGVPYCIVRGGRARLGQVVRRKSVAAVALTGVNAEDRPNFTKLLETIRTNFNDRYDEIRKQWGGGVVSKRSRTKVAKIEKAREKERLEKEQY